MIPRGLTRMAMAAAAVLTACHGSSNSPAGGASCDPSQSGCLVFSHSFSTLTVAAGAENGDLCQSWTMNNPDELWVNTVEMNNDGAYHHSNWFFVPNTMFSVPDGTWSCAQNSFDETFAALSGGVLFAQSTQAKHEVQAFPTGAVVRIPPYSRLVTDSHTLNATADSITTTMRLTITAIPAAQATVKLTPFRLTYHDLHIPPQASSEFTGSCDFATAAAKSQAGSAFALKLYYVLPHYHKLGTSFRLDFFGGANDGSEIDSIQGFNGEARGRAFDPPLDLSTNKGFTFGCGFMNPTTSEVGWGIGTNEMCEMLGYAESPLAFVASVDDGTGKVTGMTNGAVQNSGPCNVTALPWSQDKTGGTPP